MSTPRALWLAWGAVVALLAYPAGAQIIGQQSGIMGGDSGFLRPVGAAPASTVTIDAMPYARTVTCGSYTLTGTYTGSVPTWSASPSGASGSCSDTGGGTFSCVVSVAPDATGEGVETITVTNGATDTETIGFFVNGSHSCFLAQSVDGSYNSTLANADPVATWQNLGSSALDVTQGTALNQPTFVTSAVAGQPAVSANGLNWLRASTASDWIFLTESADHTAFFVFQPDTYILAVQTVASTQAAVSSTSSRGWSTFHDNRTGSSRFDRMRAFTSNGSTRIYQLESANNAVASDQYHTVNVLHDNDGGAGVDAFLYADGSLIDDDPITNAYSSLAPAGALTLFAETDNGQPLTGDIVVFLIYTSALTSTQRGINEAVMTWAMGSNSPPWTDSIPAPPVDPLFDWLFIGDSLTNGKPNVARWQDRMSVELGPTYGMRTSARGGYRTDEMIPLWDAAKTTVPDRVFFLGGTNDLAQGVTDVVAFANLTTMYQDAQGLGVEVVGITPPPMGGYAGWDATKQARMDSLNALIRASPDVDYVVDFYPPLEDPGTPDEINPALAIDAVHPNNDGTIVMRDVVLTALGL